MSKTLDEIKQEYQEEVERLLSIRALKLPSGKNNMFTLIYVPFFETEILTIRQKGVLISLFIRCGNDRIVLKSQAKLAKTLGIGRATLSRILGELEKLSYVKIYSTELQGNNGKQSDIIYIYPIDDKTALPITDIEEEIKLSIEAARKFLNQNSNALISINEKTLIKEEILVEEEINAALSEEEKKEIQKTINKALFIPAYIAFIENPLLNITDKVVYLYLLLRGGTGSVVFEDKKTLAQKININDKTLKNSIDKLIEYKYVVKFKRISSTGKNSNDVLYINNYDRFNGLPEVDESILQLKMEEAKKLYFKDDILKRVDQNISSIKQNEIFSNQLKSLLSLDSNVTDVFYDTFIENSEFKVNNDLVIMEIPNYINSLKFTINEKLEEIVLNYSKALLKRNEYLQFIIKSK